MTPWWEAEADKHQEAPSNADRLAEACAENYSGRGTFDGAGWPAIAIGAAREIIRGQDWPEFMEAFAPGREAAVFDTQLIESLTDVTRRRLAAAALVAPAVQRIARSAAAEHWTPDELLAAVRQVVAQFRPRLAHLAVEDGDVVDLHDREE